MTIPKDTYEYQQLMQTRKIIDDWKSKQNEICTSNQMVEKYVELTGKMESYYSFVKAKIEKYFETKDERQMSAAENDGRYGIVAQALVTLWFHQSKKFSIKNIEIEHANSNHTYDIEIRDNDDGKIYAVEVYTGQDAKAREMHSLARLNTSSFDERKGKYQHVDPKYGALDPNDRHARRINLCNVLDHLERLPSTHDGFLVIYGPPRHIFESSMLADIDNHLLDHECVIRLAHEADDDIRGKACSKQTSKFISSSAIGKIIRELQFKHVDCSEC